MIDSNLTPRPAPTRRGVLATIGLTGAALVGSGLIGLPATASAAPARFTTTLPNGKSRNVAVNEFDIVTFALNLEYLEAEYYLRAATGSGLTDADVSGGVGELGQVEGGSQVPFASALVKAFANEIALDEQAHVRTLRSTLAEKKRPARPPINLNTSFTAAAQSAGLIAAGETFNPFANDTNFLLGALLLSEVGASAYRGAVPLLKNFDLLNAAVGIYGVETWHTGILRATIAQFGQDNPAILTSVNAISDARDALDGPEDTDQGILNPGGNAIVDPTTGLNLVVSDSNGLHIGRDFNQVLNEVYLGAEPTANSFFPGGTNGKIQ